MTYKCKVSSQMDKDYWDGLIKKSPQATLFQTANWAKFMTEFLHATPYYIVALKGDEPVGFALLLKECLGSRYLRRRLLWRISIPMLKVVAPFYRVEYGPVVLEPYKEEGAEILKVIIHSIENITKMKPFKTVEIIPPVIENHLKDVYKKCLVESGFSSRGHATFVIDLSKDISELWRGLKKSVRKNIKRTIKRGVNIEIRNGKDAVRVYAELLEKEKRRQGRKVPFSNFYDNIFLKTKHLNEDQHAIILAKVDDKYISALSILSFNGIVHEMGVANTSYALENKLYAQDLIKWKVIEWEKKNNQRYYDLTGVSPNPKTKKEIGIYKFKEKWGGEFIKYNIYRKTA